MKNTNKKGFTIVELVIVIAVIAILAAVLIPTFASIIKKANQSADIQAVRQMNVALAADGAVVPTTQGRLFEVLGDMGMDAEDYKPLYSGRYFFWDKGINQVLYVDADAKTVLFPENVTPTSKWYSLSGDISTKNAVIKAEDINFEGGTVTLNVSNAADFVKAAEIINEKYSTIKSKTIEIVLKGDINLMGADVNLTPGGNNNKAGKVVLKSDVPGTARTISGLFISDQHVGTGNDSNGVTSKDYGASLFCYVKDITVSDIIIEDSSIYAPEASQGAFFAGQSESATFTNVTVKNSDIYAGRKSGLLVGYAHGIISTTNVTLSGCNVYSTQGEAGLLVGVLHRTNISEASSVFVNDTTITNCTIQMVDGVPSETVTVDGKEYSLVNGKDWRVSVATIGFVSDSDVAKKNVTLSSGETAEVGLYTAYETLDALAAVKGLKSAS